MGHHKPAVQVNSARARRNTRLLGTASWFALGLGVTVLATPQAFANPAGGSVASGSASISASSSKKTQIDQTTQNVVINWKSFDIANGETTQFNQPNSSAIAINRIGSANPTQIFGSLIGNGRVVLINPNGMVFGKTAKVNVGALIASTSNGNIDANGKLVFDTAGKQNALIVNQGSISASNGLVALVAPNVSNSGTIDARLGSVNLGAANKFTVDFTGDGLVSFATTGDVAKAATVSNRGSIVGTNVTMTARAAQGFATGVVNTSGIVQAVSAAGNGGAITLDGGAGIVRVSGSLNASGTTGGAINVTGGAVDLRSASLDASGLNGGGAIFAGGGKAVAVDAKSTLDVSAKTNGNGGSIGVIAGSTIAKGKAVARGGASGGDGGFVETSGHTVDFTGFAADTSSPLGKAGQWLIDPNDFTIDSAAAATIHNNLATGDVTILTSTISNGGTGNIFVTANLSWSTAHDLTLSAYRSIKFSGSARITSTGTGDLTLQADNTATGGGYVTFTANNHVSVAPGSALTILYNPTSYAAPTDFSGFVTGSAGFDFNAYMLVNTFAELQAMSSNLSGSYALNTDIDASKSSTLNGGAGFAPIGDNTNLFGGQLNGLNHAISNLFINRPSTDLVGLFGETGGTISNLNFTHAHITGGNSTGILAGTVYNGRVTNVSVAGTVNGSQNVGGLAGIEQSSQVLNSSSAATVAGHDSVGGLLGGAINGTLTDDFASGNVAAVAGSAGGLLGGAGGLTITGSSAAGNVTAGDLAAGGFIGVFTAGSIASSDSTGTVHGTGSVGGFVGSLINTAMISHSNSTGDVTGSGAEVGGFAGEIRSDASILQSDSSGDVAGSSYVGGFVGKNSGTISQAGATGDVSGADYSGGFVGSNEAGASIDTSASMGAITGTGDIGGFAGLNAGSIGGSYSYATVNTTLGDGAFVGGFVALNQGSGSISDSASLEDVTVIGDNANVGGFAGVNQAGIDDSWSQSAVSLTGANGHAGGFVGSNTGLSADILLAYAVGDVTADQATTSIGGFAGQNSATISTAYASGKLIGSGAIAGFANGSGTAIKSYWDTGSTHTSSDASGAVGITNANAYLQSTYTAFNFFPGGWVMIDGYTRPFLQSEIPSDGAIATTHQLQLMTLDTTIDYTLVADIDFGVRPRLGANAGMWTQYGFVQLGSLSGTFDGAGHTIDNFFIQRSDPANQADTGLFTNIAVTGVVQNLYMTNGSVNAGAETGMIAGSNEGRVANVHVDGLVNGYGETGGLVGDGDSRSIITGSSFAGEVIGGTDTGGLMGQTSGIITNSYATNYPPPSGVAGGVVGFADNAGGLVGSLVEGGHITDSYATNQVESTSGQNVGGLAGYSDGIIERSYTAGYVSQGSSKMGGFVGFNDVHGEISDSYSTEYINAGSVAGGFVGANAGSIQTSYASGSVTASNNTGGFVGDNEATGTITDAYSIGGAQSTAFFGGPTGGFAGANEGAITNAYSTGYASASQGFGGFIGANTGTVTNGFWDKTTSNLSNGFDINGGATATGLTSAAGEGDTAYEQGSFTGFNFAAGTGQWFIVSGFTRPFLQMERSAIITNPHQLQLVSLDPSASYVLGNDIDLSQALANSSEMWSPAGWAPLGEAAEGESLGFTSAFTGDFNGNGHAITGLTIRQFGQGVRYVGLFGFIGDPVSRVGSVHDLSVGGSVQGYDITFGDQVGAGILAAEDYGTIRNVTTSGHVSGLDNVGGLVGLLDNGTISYSSSSAQVDGNQRGGGLVGWAFGPGGVIDHTFATGTVGGVDSVFPGEPPRGGSDVTGDAVQGGLVGESDALVEYSYATGAVTAEASEAAGLVATNEGTIQYSWASGDVRSFGIFFSSGNDTAGGIAAFNAGTIQYSYSTSNVAAAGYAGGIAGQNGILHESPPNADKIGSIGSNWASGNISAGTAGGIVGWMNVGTVLNNFYDMDTTGQSAPIGRVDSSGPGVQTAGGLTTAQSMQQASYGSSLNFSATNGQWIVFNGNTRPFLRSEYSTDISNLHQLQLMALDPTASYTLTTDLDAASDFYGLDENLLTQATGMWNAATGFMPVGASAAKPFSGSLDGDGHTITALTSTRPTANYVGLFGYVTGDVSDLTLQGSDIVGSKYVGAVAGYNAGTISNVAVLDSPTYDVTGVQYTGGIAGFNAGVLSDVHSSANVNGVAYTGGVAGRNSGLIEESDDSGVTHATGVDTGGIVGLNEVTGQLVQDSTTGHVNGATYVGGVVGRNSGFVDFNGTSNGATVTSVGGYTGGVAGSNDAGATIENLTGGDFSTITAGGDYSGGLVGYNFGTIENVLSFDNVNGANYVGGIAGRNAGLIEMVGFSGLIDPSGNYAGGIAGRNDAMGTITIAKVVPNFSSSPYFGSDYLGGLVGSNYGNISLAYARVDVYGGQKIGGLIGYNAGTVDQTYATGFVNGSASVGALIGSNPAGAVVTNSYWDKDTSGVARGAGTGSITAITRLTDTSLRTTLPAGLTSANWVAGTMFNLYPELEFFAPAMGGGGGGGSP